MPDTSFKDYVLDQLRAFGGTGARAMFGGHGLFKSGLMFGLIAQDEVYFKVDDTTRPEYEMRKSKPFIYSGKGGLKDGVAAPEQAQSRAVTMNYWLVPGEVLEDPEVLKEWAMKAYDVVLKNRKPVVAQPRRRFHAARGVHR